MYYVLLLTLMAAGLACALEGDAPGLQRPPTPLPDGMPKLLPLLVDEKGAPIADAAAWRERRVELLRRWQSVLGALPKERAPLKAHVLKTEDLPEFTRQHVTYQIEDGVSTDAYLLTPKAAAPPGGFPAVVVFHPTVKTHAMEPAGVECERPERAHGPQLVKRGMVVLCPRCFIFADGADYAGNVRAMQARHPGWTGMLRMLYDGMRAADYLETVPGVNKERLGCFGHSLGAKETLYAAAFDERYKAAVFSEGGIGLAFSNWDAVWYLGPQVRKPGFALEHHQLMALVAPRGFLLLAGESADNDRSWAFFEAALPVYKLLVAPDRIGWLNHRRGHSYPEEAQRATEWFLERCLRADGR
jgi:dienelactone hydrolase